MKFENIIFGMLACYLLLVMCLTGLLSVTPSPNPDFSEMEVEELGEALLKQMCVGRDSGEWKGRLFWISDKEGMYSFADLERLVNEGKIYNRDLYTNDMLGVGCEIVDGKAVYNEMLVTTNEPNGRRFYVDEESEFREAKEVLYFYAKETFLYGDE